MSLTEQEIEEIVIKHNNYRKMYNCPPLIYCPEISEYSQKRANEIGISGKFIHVKNCPYGENLYAKNSKNSNISTCVDVWLSERYNWIEEANNWQNGMRHFSQCIWKNTQKLGIGKSQMPNGYVVVVCNYDPRGNIIGQKPY